ncbi:protein FAM169B-like [Glandiceps talaboti]
MVEAVDKGIGPFSDLLVKGKRKTTAVDEEETHPEPKKASRSEDLYVIDLLEKEEDNDSDGRRDKYYASTKSIDPENAEVFHCKYCSADVHCIKANILSCMMFGDYLAKDSHSVLLLYCWDCQPEDRAIAVYMMDKWWPTEDILRSATHKQNGWIKVTTFGERVALFVLNRIIFKQLECNDDDVTYLSHTSNENAKLLWKNSQAIAFYTYKTKGTAVMKACPYVWEIPAVDTIFVRKEYRHQGFATSLLVDFLETFPKENIGLINPISDAMMAVCYKFLLSNQEHRDRMWYCVPPGGEGYRGNLWLKFISNRRQRTCSDEEKSGSSESSKSKHLKDKKK